MVDAREIKCDIKEPEDDEYDEEADDNADDYEDDGDNNIEIAHHNIIEKK